MSEKETSNFRSILNTIEESASSFIEGFAEGTVGKPESLRNGNELDPVKLPRDLYAHSDSQTEWWYYTGHAETTAGNRFGFELVFFKRRTDHDKFGIIPIRLLGNPLYAAHFAITDYQNRQFRYSHRKSANGWFDYPASASEEHYHLVLGDWSLRESHGNHILRATTNNDLKFDAVLEPKKEVIINGAKKDGVAFKDKNEASRYFSYTRMEMEGDIVWNGETEHFKGSAWMDREFGTWVATENQKGWDWFSIQLGDNTELMCYQLRNGADEVSPYSSGAYVEENGAYNILSHDEFEIVPTGYWRSPHTKTTYPSGWRVKVPKYDLDLAVDPVMEDQELDTRGTTMVIYWEGACNVKGKASGNELTGNAYVELVGYDRSHESPNLAHFLMGNSFEFPPRSIFGR